MKLFGRNQNKDKDVEKPIITYHAKYIGVLSSNKSFPTEEGAYVNIYEDRIGVELLKRKFRTIIPYKSMTDIRSVDTGKKVDPIQDTNQPKLSIADELSKLAKLKEQGVITEEEFSQMKRNLMEGMK